jgi:hypothetical protein
MERAGVNSPARVRSLDWCATSVGASRSQQCRRRLEDAGCSEPELLGHLRGPGPHVRGCWVVDLLLEKE